MVYLGVELPNHSEDPSTNFRVRRRILGLRIRIVTILMSQCNKNEIRKRNTYNSNNVDRTIANLNACI